MKPQRRSGTVSRLWYNGNGRYPTLMVLWRRLLIVLGIGAFLLLGWITGFGLQQYWKQLWPPPAGSFRDHAYQFFLVENGRNFAIACALYGLLVISAFHEEVSITFDRKARIRLAWLLLLAVLASALAAALAWHFYHSRFG